MNSFVKDVDLSSMNVQLHACSRAMFHRFWRNMFKKENVILLLRCHYTPLDSDYLYDPSFYNIRINGPLNVLLNLWTQVMERLIEIHLHSKSLQIPITRDRPAKIPTTNDLSISLRKNPIRTDERIHWDERRFNESGSLCTRGLSLPSSKDRL